MLNWSYLSVMKSVLNRDKFEMPGMSFSIKGGGSALQVDIKPGAAVFEGKLEGTINPDSEVTAFFCGLKGAGA